MGADSQPMVLLQLLARVLHARQDPADAVAAARWVLAAPSTAAFGVWEEPAGVRVRIEGHAPPAWVEGLRAFGHEVEVIEPFTSVVGHAHVVTIDAETAMRAGATDPRALTGQTAVL